MDGVLNHALFDFMVNVDGVLNFGRKTIGARFELMAEHLGLIMVAFQTSAAKQTSHNFGI